eukprot:Hpha_TRINITY_DN4993_c0_g1::TRINITY_DN4993_c0_g1_i1::g.51314::m.51314/K00784/rnz; ribonuclease Z
MLHLQFLGCDGTGVPSIMVANEQQRFFFNCPEGTQRFCNEAKVKMTRTQAFFLTRLHPDTLLGMPGMLLTIHEMERSSIAKGAGLAKEQPKETDRQVQIYGPPGTGELVTELHPFVRCKAFYTARDAPRGGELQELNALDRPTGSVLAMPWEGGLLYAIELSASVGRFLPDKAKALGVAKGPKFSKLARGESVESDKFPGRTVAAADVTAPADPPTRAVIVDAGCSLQNVEALADALRSLGQGLAARGGGDAVNVVFHLSPGEVVEAEAYREAALRVFPGATHLQRPRTGDSPGSVFLQSARQHALLSSFAPRFFPPERRPISSAPPPEPAPPFRLALPLVKYSLAGGKCGPTGLVDPPAPPGGEVPAEVTQAMRKQGVLTSAGEEGPLELCFLGTGGMMPSKYRNVSATLCRLADGTHVMLDTGEGTLGQLGRALESDRVLRSMGLVWISHMHADHHLGLPSLLHARSLLSPSRPTHVVGPGELERYLSVFERICGVPLAFTFSTCDSAMRGKELLEGKVELRCVPVDHCPDAWGCVLQGDGWKAVFSGDCQPTESLVEAGKGADVLVHEATFEDGMEDDAAAKRHSTVGGALGVAAAMGARCTVLTHFSQRYTKGPPSGAKCKVGLAFDLMRLRVGDEAHFEAMAEPLRVMEEYYAAREESKRADNLKKGEEKRTSKQAEQKELKQKRSAEYLERCKRQRRDEDAGGDGKAGEAKPATGN